MANVSAPNLSESLDHRFGKPLVWKTSGLLERKRHQQSHQPLWLLSAFPDAELRVNLLVGICWDRCRQVVVEQVVV
ncbi:Hypothetical predicted protein [Scomber scombrus]|uniref:Uncharacterized protein n=1 Tax=Scomber scombrus TaxID=13677 RepID=A0AAV1NRJ1_SCOSC